MATWYGMIRCASCEMSSRLVSMPRSSRPPSSVSNTPGSMTTPLPMTLVTPGVRIPDGIRCRANFCPSGSTTVWPGVVAALVAHHPLHPLAVQVGGLALALVAPLGADEHHHRHGTLPSSTARRPAGRPRRVRSSRRVHGRHAPEGRVVVVQLRSAAHRAVLLPAADPVGCRADAGRRAREAGRTGRRRCDHRTDGPGLWRPDRSSVGRGRARRSTALLTGRVLVVGDDADLAAVVLRLLRKELLGAVEVAYRARPARTPVTDLWGLPAGAGAVAAGLGRPGRPGAAGAGRRRRRAGRGRLNSGRWPARSTSTSTGCCAARPTDCGCSPIRPEGAGRHGDRDRRFAGLPAGPPDHAWVGRCRSARCRNHRVRDGVPYPRPMDRWTFYKHTEPLRVGPRPR